MPCSTWVGPQFYSYVDSEREVRADRKYIKPLIGEHLRNNFAFMIEETSGASGVEQTAVVVRVVKEQLALEEIILGWHATAMQDSFTLVKLLEDSLLPFLHEPRR